MIESFHITITYKNKERQFGITPMPDQFARRLSHDVWEDGVYFFTLIPTVDQDMTLGGKIRIL
ncbi:MAG: hypothetical protein M3R50_00500 [Bacteroidota bacterium]|nr:hypothetical protein [Bacteroidota bacterium]